MRDHGVQRLGLREEACMAAVREIVRKMDAVAGLWEDAARRVGAGAAGAPTHSEAAANRAHAETLRDCAGQLRGFARAIEEETGKRV